MPWLPLILLIMWQEETTSGTTSSLPFSSQTTDTTIQIPARSVTIPVDTKYFGSQRNIVSFDDGKESKDNVHSIVIIFEEDDLKCLGNLISEKNVVTAASCVTEILPGDGGKLQFTAITPASITLRIGSTRADQGGKLNYAWSIYVHPDFLKDDRVDLYRDVAMINLWFSVRVAPNIQVSVLDIHSPAAENGDGVGEGVTCEKITWEKEPDKKKGAEILSTTDVNIEKLDVCKKSHTNILASAQVCSKVTETKCHKRADTLKGSGLICNNSLLAVMSWPCQHNMPQVFARVDNIIAFINASMNLAATRSSEPLYEALVYVFSVVHILQYLII